MTDVGTRLDHLNDLKDLWELGLRVLNNQSRLFDVTRTKLEIQKLEAALELLNAHMQKDFNEINYIAAINTLPKLGE
jgi:hypothetical protein